LGLPPVPSTVVPKKRHPLHRRVKRVHIVNLEPSRPAADADRSTVLILLH
jgi:hypothetical protein